MILVFVFLIVLSLYITITAHITQHPSGRIEIRVGWFYYRRHLFWSASHSKYTVYRIRPVFHNYGVQVEDKDLESYILSIVEQTFDIKKQNKTINKRFLRKFFW
jgi:hypothetical protein